MIRLLHLSGALLALPIHSLSAQRATQPVFLTAAYTATTFATYRRPYEGLMLGAAVRIVGPVDLALRGHFFREDDDAMLGMDLVAQAGISRAPFEVVGMVGLSMWGPDYTGDVSDRGITRLTTVAGVQLRAWPIRQLGIVWEAVDRGWSDKRNDGSHHLALGLIARL